MRDPGGSVDEAQVVADLATFHWDIARDTLIFSNRALALFGLMRAPPDLNGLLDRIHPDDRTGARDRATAFLRDGAAMSQEVRILRPDNAVRQVIVHLIGRRPGHTDGIACGLFIDVTRERTRDLNADGAVSSDILGFYDLDLAARTSVLSPLLQQVLGHAGSCKVPATSHADQIHPDDRKTFEAGMDAAQRRPGPFEFSYRIVDRDGTVRHVSDRGEAHGPVDPDTGRVSRVTGSLTDVTVVVLAQREAYQAFWQMLDTAPFGVYAVNADFRIVRVSPGGAAAFAGIEPLIGRDLAEVLRIIWPDPFASEAIGHFRETLKTGVRYQAPPVIEQRNDNHVIEAYDWAIDRMVLDDGRRGIICHFYDLTERVRHEDELRQKERRLSLAYDAADMGAWDVDLADDKTFWTPQLFRMFDAPEGSTEAADLFQNRVHPNDISLVAAAFVEAAGGGTPFDIDFRIVLDDGGIRYFASKGELVLDASGTPHRMIGVNFDITRRKKAELALRASEERLKTVIDSAISFIGVLDPDGVLREANSPALDVANLQREDVIGKPFWDTYWWSHDATVAARLEAAIAAAARGEIQKYDTVVRIADGALIEIEFLLVPVLDSSGKVSMLVASGFDVSERERNRERVQNLMGEINHRAKNILTLVQIVARQSARGNREDFIPRFEKRIQALAAAQSILVNTGSDVVSLADLAQSQLGHLQDLIGKRLHIDGPAVEIGARAAQAVGMALHELATNAGKYGALSGERGEVHLTWTLTPLDGRRQITMVWQESGGPPVTTPDRQGFGSSVIDQMTSASLEGEVEMNYAPEGLRWQLQWLID